MTDKCDICGSTTVDHNELNCSMNRQIFSRKPSEQSIKADERALGHIDVIRHLRRYARNYIMKADERAKGFYEALEEAERYFNACEDAELRAKLEAMKGEWKC